MKKTGLVKNYKKFLEAHTKEFVGYYEFNNEQIDQQIQNNCHEYNPQKTEIVRDINKKPEYDVNYIVNPMQRKRKSDGFFNTYTLLIDNFKSWEEFPRRDHALIATLNRKEKESKRIKHTVYPFDGAVWGVCPANDIWYKWKKFGELFGSDGVHYWIEKFNHLYPGDHLGDGLSNTDYDKLVEQLNGMKERLIEQGSKPYISKRSPLGRFSEYIKDIDKPLIEILEDLMNPYENGFRLCTNTELDDLPPREYEIWTNDKVILKSEATKENNTNVKV